MIAQTSIDCARDLYRQSSKFSANDNGGNRASKKIYPDWTAPHEGSSSAGGRGVNTRAGIIPSSMSTLRFASVIQNWPPRWPLLLMALAFAVGWIARGICSPEKFQPPTIQKPHQYRKEPTDVCQ